MRKKETDSAPEYLGNFADLGQKFIRLGEALRDPNTTIDELAKCAFLAGVKLQFRVS